MEKVPSVLIDSEGRFKYILIRMYLKDGDDDSKNKLCVRGNKEGPYHGDIYDAFMATLDETLDSECLGGGRIEHDPGEKSLKVYGYSQGFGKADHSITVDLLKQAYPSYNITWSNDGY